MSTQSVPTHPDGRTVFGYIRVSTDRQEVARQEQTIPARHAKLPDGLAGNALELFDDYGISAWSGKPRPGFDEMLVRIRRGEASALIVDTSSRLTRAGIRAAMSIFFTLEDVKTRLFTTQGREYAFDLGGIISLIVDAEADNRYSTTLSHNTRTGRETKIRAGKWVHGLTPPGYRRNEDAELEDTADLNLMTAAFGRLLEGESYRNICDFLTASLSDEVLDRTRHGQMKQDHLRLLFRNPVYAGFIPLNDERLEGKHKAAVSLETFDRVQRMLDARAADKTKPPRSWPLTGIARCPTCGRALGYRSTSRAGSSRSYGYVRCQNKDCAVYDKQLVASLFEANVVLALTVVADVVGHILAADPEWATSPDNGDEARQRARETLAAAEDRLHEMTALVLARSIKTNHPDFESAKVERDVAEAEYERLARQEASFRDQLATITTRVESLAERAPTDRASERMRMDDVMVTDIRTGRVRTHHTIARVLEGWLAADFETRRSIVVTLLEAIYADSEEVRLHFRIGFPQPLVIPLSFDLGSRSDAAPLRDAGWGVSGDERARY
jgi:DNA invertase Pin-like site-specific DNA recombinase